jgi:protein SMG6
MLSSALGMISVVQAILRDSVVSVEIEVKPHNLVPDTNCFIDYLSQLQIIARAGPAPQHYYTLMVPLVGKCHTCDLLTVPL